MATIKDLIGKGPDELEKMTDDELRKWCEPYLRIAVVPLVAETNKQGEIDLSSGDGPTIEEKKAARKSKKALSKEEMMEEIRKLALLHGVDAGIPTPIKG